MSPPYGTMRRRFTRQTGSVGSTVAYVEIAIGIILLFTPFWALGVGLIISGLGSLAAAHWAADQTPASDKRESPTYGYLAFRNPVKGDAVIPVIYSYNGHKTAPVWLQAFVTPRGNEGLDFVKIRHARGQGLSGLMAVGEGPNVGFEDLEFNGEPAYTKYEAQTFIEKPNGSRKEFTLAHPFVDIFSIRLSVNGVLKGWKAANRSVLVGIGTDVTTIFSVTLPNNVMEEVPLLFFDGDPATNTLAFKLTYLNGPQAIVPRPWLVTPTRLLVSTQRPFPLKRKLFAQIGEWIFDDGITVKQDKDGNTVVKFGTAPASTAVFSLDYLKRNIPGLKVWKRLGGEHQLPIPGFDAIRNTYGVGQELVKGTAHSVERATRDLVDDLIIDIASGPSGFTVFDEVGDRSPSSAQFRIEIKLQTTRLSTNGSPNIFNAYQIIPDPAGKRTFSAKSALEFEVRGDSVSQLFWALSIRNILQTVVDQDPKNTTNTRLLDDFVRAKYWIKLTRTNEVKQASNVSFIDSILWGSFQEVLFEGLNLPMTGLLAFHAAPSEKLNGSAPNVTVKARGIQNVQRWTGTRWLPDAEAQSNAVWAAIDCLTNTRYGSGNFYTLDDIDTTSAKLCADWLDELVSKGKGSSETEKRGQLDIVLDTRQAAMIHVREMLLPKSIWIVQRGTTWFFVKDDAVDLTQVTAATYKVVRDSGKLGRASKRSLTMGRDPIVATPTEIQIVYKDGDQRFEQGEVWVPLEEGADEPRRIHRATATGIIRTSEATRYAAFLYARLRNQGRALQVAVSPTALHYGAGDVIRVISARLSLDSYFRIRRLTFSTDKYQILLECFEYVASVYSIAFDKRIILKTAPRVLSAAVTAPTASAGGASSTSSGASRSG